LCGTPPIVRTPDCSPTGCPLVCSFQRSGRPSHIPPPTCCNAARVLPHAAPELRYHRTMFRPTVRTPNCRTVYVCRTIELFVPQAVCQTVHPSHCLHAGPFILRTARVDCLYTGLLPNSSARRTVGCLLNRTVHASNLYLPADCISRCVPDALPKLLLPLVTLPVHVPNCCSADVFIQGVRPSGAGRPRVARPLCAEPLNHQPVHRVASPGARVVYTAG